MASPILYARFEPRLYERVLQAAEAEGLALSAFLRMAVSEHLGTVEREAAERAELLAEARRFLAAGPGTTDVDLRARRLVERYVAALDSTAGRISEAEQRGRARALREVAFGALEPIDGTEVTFGEFRPDGPPVALEATSPRRRGYLREHLAAERARALLQAPPPASSLPSAAGLLGEERTRELWNEAIGWPGWRRLFCRHHGIVPSSPDDSGRCYLGCSVDDPERP